MSKRKYISLNFSSADDRALIRSVQKHDILWDVGNRDYRNCGKEKETLWAEIADSLKKTVPEVKKRWRHLQNYRKSLKRKTNGKNMRAQRDENILIDIEEAFRGSPNTISYLDTGSTELMPPMANGETHENAPQEIFKAQDIFEVEPQSAILTGKLEIEDTALEVQPEPVTSPFSLSATLEHDPSYTSSNGDGPDSDAVFRLRDDPAILLSEIFRDIVSQASKEVHPIKKLFDCFADCVLALPEDLQRDCKNRVMLMISEYEETASYRRTQGD